MNIVSLKIPFLNAHNASIERQLAALRIRSAIADPILRDHGMDTSPSVQSAISKIPGFEDDPNLMDHDLCHGIGNIFSGHSNDTYPEENRVETHGAFLVQAIAFWRNYDPKWGAPTREIIMANARRAMKKVADRQLKRRLDPNHKHYSPNLAPENWHNIEKLITRAVDSREFFEALTGEKLSRFRTLTSKEVNLPRIGTLGNWLADMPLSYSGIFMNTRSDGMAESFEFYPEETRAAVLKDLQEQLSIQACPSDQIELAA